MKLTHDGECEQCDIHYYTDATNFKRSCKENQCNKKNKYSYLTYNGYCKECDKY